MRFRRERLPSAESFYRKALGQLSRRNHKGWSKANCFSHRSRSKTSLSVNLDTGAFFCHGCGVKGGDIVAFLRLRDGLSFKDACKQLGAWDDDGKPPRKRCLGPTLRYLIMDFVVDGVEHYAPIEDEPKNELQQLRRFHAEAKDRLHEIHHSSCEQFDGEEEVQWGILASTFELIRMEEVSRVR